MPDLNWVEKKINVHGVDLKGFTLLVPGVNDFTAVEFNDPPEWQSDPDKFFSGVDTTKITIPKKHAGRYYLCATIRWERSDHKEYQIPDRDSCSFLAYLTKNGDTMEHHLEDSHMSAAPIVKASKTVMNLLWEGRLRKDDFIKLFIARNGTIIGDDDLPVSIMVNVWLTLRRLGTQKP